MTSLKNLMLQHGPGFLTGFTLCFIGMSLLSTESDDAIRPLPIEQTTGYDFDVGNPRASSAPAIRPQRPADIGSANIGVPADSITNRKTASNPRSDVDANPISSEAWDELTQKIYAQDQDADYIYDNIDVLASLAAGDPRKLSELAQMIQAIADPDGEMAEALILVAEQLPESDMLGIASELTRSTRPENRIQALDLMSRTETSSDQASNSLADLITYETNNDVLQTAFSVAEVSNGNNKDALLSAIETQATGAANPQIKRSALLSLAKLGGARGTTQRLVEKSLRSQTDEDIRAGLEAMQIMMSQADDQSKAQLRARFNSLISTLTENKNLSADIRAAALQISE